MSRFSQCGAVVVASLAGGVAVAQPSFQGLGSLGAPVAGTPGSFANRVSANGKVVVGFTNSPLGRQPFRWTQTDGMIGLGKLPGGTFGGQAWASSVDGSVIIGEAPTATTIHAFRWTLGSGMVDLGDLPGGADRSAAWDCNADGSVVVGIASFKYSNIQEGLAFKWTQGTGMVDLGGLPVGPLRTDAEAVSADGSIVAGCSGTQLVSYEACRWVGNAPAVGLGLPYPANAFSCPFAMTPDGSVIAGVAAVGDNAYEVFRWTESTGMVTLGDLPGGEYYGTAFGLSADGSVIVGCGNFYNYTATENLIADAIIWDNAHGLRKLQDVLENEYHLNLRGWTLTSANGISADGLTIVGSGVNPFGEDEGWIVRLDCTSTPTCPSDFNGDGFVTGDDFDLFVNAFEAGC